MNEHKFAFIICTNDNLLLEECIHYINHLSIPTGYELELLTIPDAPCITRGYNEGMNASDAQFKIYMHQDVFLLNKNILGDLLSIFASDPQIGLIGMVGYEKVSPDGIMWHVPRSGNLYTRREASLYPDLSSYRYSIQREGYCPVAEVDGFFMATCRDLPWNTDVLKGWDFYDAFQSIQFLKNGYKVVVPVQNHPWCLHDDNKFLNLSDYNAYRQIFLKTYSDILGKDWAEVLGR